MGMELVRVFEKVSGDKIIVAETEFVRDVP